MNISVSWIKRLLHLNWPLIIAGGAFAVVIGWYFYVPNYLLGIPRFYYAPLLNETVDYWSLVSPRNNWLSYLPFVVVIIFSVITLIVFVKFDPRPARHFVGLCLTFLANICSLCVCIGAGFSYCETNITHQQTLDFHDSDYQLAYIQNSSSDCDAPSWTFVVYECDILEQICRTNYVHPQNPFAPLADEATGTLIIDSVGDTLYLQIGGETVYTVH